MMAVTAFPANAMNTHPAPQGASAGQTGAQYEIQPSDLTTSRLVVEVFESSPPEIQEKMITQLIGRVYEAAPPMVRSRLIGHLMQPLGLLSLLALANGIFAKIRFRGDWQGTAIPLSEVDSINTRDVIALVDFVQQVSRDAVNGLAQVLVTSPAMSSTAAAAVLMTVLMRRARQRRATDIARPAPGG